MNRVAATTITRTFAIIDRYGFELDRVTVELPVGANEATGHHEAIRQYVADVRAGYEPGSYKADMVIASIDRAELVTVARAA